MEDHFIFVDSGREVLEVTVCVCRAGGMLHTRVSGCLPARTWPVSPWALSHPPDASDGDRGVKLPIWQLCLISLL